MIKKLIKKIWNGLQTSEKNKPVILTFEEHGIHRDWVSPSALEVIYTLQNKGFDAFIVGGAVRDLLLNKKPKDFDIATNATPEQVKSAFKRAFIIGRRFKIVHILLHSELIEVTTFRKANAKRDTQDATGRILQDNTFGLQHEDATRRDFTVNAMYYDPSTQMLLDYHHGIADIHNKVLRMIGDPTQRYREDPVRMLRVVRLAAKLGFTIESQTQAPIKTMASLIHHVPSARIFDEMLKLLTNGHALASLHRLRDEGLHHGLLPLLDIVLETPLGEKFITLVLNKTDERILDNKPTSPGFLFAALLWHQVLEKWKQYEERGEHPIPALHLAADDVLEKQTQALAIQRRIVTDMKDIWNLQPRFEKRVGKAPLRLIEQPRFKAGLDFFILRAEVGETDTTLARWWENFWLAQEDERFNMLATLPDKPVQKKKRKAARSTPAP